MPNSNRLNVHRPIGYLTSDDFNRLTLGHRCSAHPYTDDHQPGADVMPIFTGKQYQRLVDGNHHLSNILAEKESELQTQYDAFTELAIRHEECKKVKESSAVCYMCLAMLAGNVAIYRLDVEPSRRIVELCTLIVKVDPTNQSPALKDRFGIFSPENYEIQTTDAVEKSLAKMMNLGLLT